MGDKKKELELLALKRKRMLMKQETQQKAPAEEGSGILDYASEGIDYAVKGLDWAGGAVRAGTYGLHDLVQAGRAALDPDKEFIDYPSMTPSLEQIGYGRVPQYNEAVRESYPEFYKKHETAVDVAGFVGGMMADPLSYARVTGAAANFLKPKLKALQDSKIMKEAWGALETTGNLAKDLGKKISDTPITRPIAIGGELTAGAIAKTAGVIADHVVPTTRMYNFGVRKLDEFAAEYGKIKDYAPSKILRKYGIFGSETGVAAGIAKQTKKHEDMFWKALDEFGDASVDLQAAKNEITQLLQKEYARRTQSPFGHAVGSKALEPYVNALAEIQKYKFTSRFNPRTANEFKTSLYNAVDYLNTEGRGDLLEGVIKKFAQATKEQTHNAIKRKAFLKQFPQAKEFARNAQFDEVFSGLGRNVDMDSALMGRQPTKMRPLEERDFDRIIDGMIENPTSPDMAKAAKVAKDKVADLERIGQEWGTLLTISKKSNVLARSERGRPLVSNVGAMAASYSPKVFAATQAHKIVTSPAYHTTMGYVVPEMVKTPAARRGLVEMYDAHQPEKNQASPWGTGGR